MALRQRETGTKGQCSKEPRNEGPMLETLDYTIRIGSTPTFLYFDVIEVTCTEHISDPEGGFVRTVSKILNITLNHKCIANYVKILLKNKEHFKALDLVSLVPLLTIYFLNANICYFLVTWIWISMLECKLQNKIAG